MKRSGRTILVVLLGLAIYTLFLFWYDGVPVHPTDLQDLDLTKTPSSLQPVITTLVEEPFLGDIYLITAEDTGGLTSWSRAIIKDPIVQMGLGQKMTAAFPQGAFHVIRFPNVMALVSAVSQTGSDSSSSIEGVLVRGDRYRIHLKLAISLLLGLGILVSVQRLDRPSK